MDDTAAPVRRKRRPNKRAIFIGQCVREKRPADLAPAQEHFRKCSDDYKKRKGA